MSPNSARFFQNWLVNTFGVLVATFILPGVECDSLFELAAASLLLGVLNASVKPLLMVVALPFLLMTLGLFLIVINALLLSFVAWVVPAFHIDSFGWAMLGAIIIGTVSLLTNGVLGRPQVKVNRRPPPPKDDGDDSNGPVIDV